MVEHGDVAGPEPRQQHLGAAFDPRGARQAGQVEGGFVADWHRHMVSAGRRPPRYPGGLGASALRRGPAGPRRAARGRGRGRCRSRSGRPSSATARAPGPRRRARSGRSSSPMPSSDLATTTWRSANAATWGRWVTTSTWALRASRASRRPTSTAAAPPTPASTSSKTNVGTVPVAGQADLQRQHHPATARRRRRPCGAGGARRRRWPRAAARPVAARLAPKSSRSVTHHLEPGVRHGEGGQLVGDRARRAARPPSCAGRGQLGGDRGQLAPAAGRARPRSSSIRSSVPSRSSQPRPRTARARPAPRRRCRRTCGSARSAPPAARRPPPAGAGSVSTDEAYDATSAARSASR